MQIVNITELRSHLPEYLSNAQKGDEVLVTSHGHVIARILPPIDTKSEAQKKLKALQKCCKIKDVISPLDVEWENNK